MIRFLVFLCFYSTWFSAHGRYVGCELQTFPVERVIRNLEREVRELGGRNERKRDALILSLARLHAMIYAQGWKTVDADKCNGTSWGGYRNTETDGRQLSGYGRQFFRKDDLKKPDRRAIAHLKKSIELYERISPATERGHAARLGLAWTLHQDGQTERAKKIYRDIIAAYSNNFYSREFGSRIEQKIVWAGRYSQINLKMRREGYEISKNIYSLLVQSLIAALLDHKPLQSKISEGDGKRLRDHALLVAQAMEEKDHKKLSLLWAELEKKLKRLFQDYPSLYLKIDDDKASVVTFQYIEHWLATVLNLYEIATGRARPDYDYLSGKSFDACKLKSGLSFFQERAFSGFQVCAMNLAAQHEKIDLCDEMARLTKDYLAQTYCVARIAVEKKNGEICGKVDKLGEFGYGLTESDCRKAVLGRRDMWTNYRGAPSVLDGLRGASADLKKYNVSFSMDFEVDLRGYPEDIRLFIKDEHIGPPKVSVVDYEHAFYKKSENTDVPSVLELSDGIGTVTDSFAFNLPADIGRLKTIARAPKELDYERYVGGFYIAEVASYLSELLDPIKDKAEHEQIIKTVWFHVTGDPVRMITPVAIPIEAGVNSIEDVIDDQAAVRFDLDGSGMRRKWRWITKRVGWLVHNPPPTGGKITSAIQLFGSVTFWLFWDTGYEAMKALDDNGDGWLKGKEMRDLALWHDRNKNGISESGEVKPLADWGVERLSTDYDGHPQNGYWSEKGVQMSDGSYRNSFDIVLEAVP